MVKFKLPDELRFLKNSRASQKSTDISMAGKVCVVSGSTSGVGLEAVRRLARGNAHIVMLCRNPEKAKRIRQAILAQHAVQVDVVVADFRDLGDVRRAAAILERDYPRIDVLINSAGVYRTSRTTTPAGFETVFCVNHLAPFLLIYLLLDKLRQSAPARIINVNSEGHRFGGLNLDDLDWKRRLYVDLRSYGAAKTAQLLTTWEYSDRLAGTGVTINAMHPGDVKTNIGEDNGPIYRWFKHNVIWHMLKDPIISGEALYYLAAAPELANVSGRFFHLTIEERPAAHALDRVKGKRVWELSLQLAGLSPNP